MLADQLDYIIGVDPHRDSHAIAIVEVVSGAVVFEATVDANSDGYARALKLVEELGAARRAFAVEGTGSFGAGLTRFLTGRGERVLEVGRLRRERFRARHAEEFARVAAAPAARRTPSTLSARPAVCLPSSSRRRRGRAVNARRCRHLWPHAK